MASLSLDEIWGWGGACFTNVDKFVTPTSACSCLLHMHAGVYYTGTQVSMTPARRCPWYLHADVYYTCLQVTIAQMVTQMGMQLSMTLARRCLWQQHADVFDTCTQIHCDQDDVIIILIHLDTYDYDLLTSWQVDIYCPDNSETFRIIYKLSIQSQKCTCFLETVWTLQEVSRQYTNCPENPETFRRYITCPENPETFWIIEKISGWFSA